MPGTPLTPPFLVCSDCRTELQELGATVSTERRQISSGHACEVHPVKVAVQSQHAVYLSMEVLQAFRARAAERVRPVDPALLGDAVSVEVARIAGQLLAGSACTDLFLTDDVIENAVSTARRLLVAAKEGR